MSEDALRIANFRVHVVPAVLALANPPWQRDVWLDPSKFEDLDHVFHTLFDDFCDAEDPERYLGISLRTLEEVALMRELGAALNAASAQAPNDTDEEYLRATVWPDVVAAAGRLAQVMVANDLRELAALRGAAAQKPVKTVSRADGNSQ
ncbi:SCO4402 family protein [Streptomyces sp. NPDC055060]